MNLPSLQFTGNDRPLIPELLMILEYLSLFIFCDWLLRYSFGQMIMPPRITSTYLSQHCLALLLNLSFICLAIKVHYLSPYWFTSYLIISSSCNLLVFLLITTSVFSWDQASLLSFTKLRRPNLKRTRCLEESVKGCYLKKSLLTLLN